MSGRNMQNERNSLMKNSQGLRMTGHKRSSHLRYDWSGCSNHTDIMLCDYTLFNARLNMLQCSICGNRTWEGEIYGNRTENHRSKQIKRASYGWRGSRGARKKAQA